MNFIFQRHGDFRAPYTGPQSLRPASEQALSRVLTLYTVANSGAYDYAADTRGYTYGVIVEYGTPR